MKDKIIIAGVVVAILLSGFAYFGIEDGKDGRNGIDGIGAVASPNILSSYLSWGASHGIRTWKAGQALRTGTSTVCAIQSPAATSTLISAGVKFDVASSTATTVYLAKAATAFATTTAIGEAVLGAGEKAVILATSTLVSNIDDLVVFAPLQYFIVNLKGGDVNGTSVGLKASGSCYATWDEYLSL